MADKPILLRLARLAAVLVALTVLGYLAYDAQDRANPPAHAGAQTNAEPVDTGVQHGPLASEAVADPSPALLEELEDDYMYSSKSMPLRLPGEDAGTAPFLSSSKSGVVVLPEDFVITEVEGDPYLPSSKVLMLDISELPPPLPVVEDAEPIESKSDAPKAP